MSSCGVSAGAPTAAGSGPRAAEQLSEGVHVKEEREGSAQPHQEAAFQFRCSPAFTFGPTAEYCPAGIRIAAPEYMHAEPGHEMIQKV